MDIATTLNLGETLSLRCVELINNLRLMAQAMRMSRKGSRLTELADRVDAEEKRLIVELEQLDAALLVLWSCIQSDG
jgi:hypothetical protein